MKNKLEELYKIKADILRALAHPVRLKIVDFLCKGEKCVCEIVKITGAERTGISKHLSILQKADILESRKEGLWIYYKLKMACATDFLCCAEEIIKKQAKARMNLIKK
jgi:ArsR family transcriptional regulator